jgi:di/tricarboxylate transporter
MTHDQILLLAILFATLLMFIWGRWRHDAVAMGSLLACLFTGLVPMSDAFSGFAHPAVITVACVFVLSRGLQTTGAVDTLAHRLLPTASGPMLTIGVLIGIGALLSAFMNNVGAMALLMPVAIQLASKYKLQPGQVLMPLSFGTILGGMTTLIGTPPNLIVAGFRQSTGAGSFRMFDFTPVGLAVAVAGIVFVILLGRRIVPRREGSGVDTFDTGTYLTEVAVTGEGRANGRTIKQIDDALIEVDAQVVGMVRNEFRVLTPNPNRVVRKGDILVIEADPASLASVLSRLGLKLEEDVRELKQQDEGAGGPEAETAAAGSLAGGATGNVNTEVDPRGGAADEKREVSSKEIALQEFVPLPESSLLGRSASDIHLRTRHGLNLLAVSRSGRRSIRRLRSTLIRTGDVLLMQGPPDSLAAFAAEFSCVPLAGRAISIPDKRKALTASAVMLLAVAGSALGILPAAVSFAAGVLAYLVLGVIPAARLYDAIDWPVVVLLGALIPVAGATAATGTADLLARLMLDTFAQGNAVVALVLTLVAAMTLSDFMNNAATAAVLCPIAISTAMNLGASADAFLMAVAIGASCAFLTPIGHQNNTLILGPGGFRFGDYWRLGLPVEILVVLVSVPLLLMVWPL